MNSNSKSNSNSESESEPFSNAILNLSFNDRNAINEEIHGVSCMAPEETNTNTNFKQFREKALREMGIELNKIQKQDKWAFERAQVLHQKEELLKKQQLETIATSCSIAAARPCNSNAPMPEQQATDAAAASSTNNGNIAYVNTDDFRLKFLRCELYDAKKAAQRMVKYMDLVHKVYGVQALKRPISLENFSREDMAFLRGGDYQILPYRDRSGRRILCIVTNNRNDISAEVRMKILIYLWVVAGEDVESQRKGAIVISYSGPKITEDETADNKQQQRKFHSSRVKSHVVVASAVPVRIVAIHFCLPNTSGNSVFSALSNIYGMVLGAWSSRVKFHLGESIEIRYQLKCYGIPVELIPSTDTGNVKHVNLKQWIKLRKFLEREQRERWRQQQQLQMQQQIQQHAVALERQYGHGQIVSDSEDTVDSEYSNSSNASKTSSSIRSMQKYYQMQQQQQQYVQHLQYPLVVSQLPLGTNIVECPGSNDVIFRRGKSMTCHPGNVMFQSLIESRLEAHTEANQAGKLAIVLELIHTIRSVKGGRFLTWESKFNGWMDMNTNIVNANKNDNDTRTQTADQELEIQSKVYYAFRDFKKKMKTAQNLQISRSSTYAFERQDGIGRKRIKGGCGNRNSNSNACVMFGCVNGNENGSDNTVSD